MIVVTVIKVWKKNKKQGRISDKKVWYPLQKITMDIMETDTREHIIMITDGFPGYAWAEKNGEKQTGIIIDTS